MTNTGDTIGGSGPPRGGSALIYLPIAWVAIVVLLSIYTISVSWPATYDYRLPDSALYLVYAGIVAAIVNIVWGLYLLGLGYNHSARFPRHFTIWQIANILWMAATEAYVLVTPDFVFSPKYFAMKLAEIAIGIFCIHLLRRKPDGGAVYSNAETDKPPLLVSFIAAVLGVVLGAVVGAIGGFLIGGGIAEATDMSCFEGACGYFAAAIGLLGLLVGAIGGGIFAVWRTNRRKSGA